MVMGASRGWLGVNLDKGISWKVIASLLREAYTKVAPARLANSLGETIQITPPTRPMKPEEVDPLQSKRAQSVLKQLRASARSRCSAIATSPTAGC